MRRQSHIYRLCYLLLALVIAPQGSAEERNDAAFSGIEWEMSAEERRATGIDSLSADELEALNRWLMERFDQVQETVSAEVRQEVREAVLEEVREEAREADAAEREQSFEAEIVGNFSGWSGGTIFRLDNGELWRQRNDGTYRHRGEDRRVRIEQGFFGLWRMVVISSGVSVPVAPVE